MDTGPGIQFQDVDVECYEDNVGPDSFCGNEERGWPYLSPGAKWNSGLLYGNRLDDSNEYYGKVTGQFIPNGYPLFTIGPLESKRFNCYGNDNCYFP